MSACLALAFLSKDRGAPLWTSVGLPRPARIPPPIRSRASSARTFGDFDLFMEVGGARLDCPLTNSPRRGLTPLTIDAPTSTVPQLRGTVRNDSRGHSVGAEWTLGSGRDLLKGAA